ncbi:MAG: O-methyltransferase [Clostridia bacterium]|nr:O-methyltransferase [Clostridia bacterium]
MEKFGITYDHITEYLHALRRERQGELAEKEKLWRSAGLPIAEPEVGDLIEIMCRLKQPSKILEIGACVCFSALLMSQTVPDAEITTIERNPVMIKDAKENLEYFDKNKKITLLEGDAAKILPDLSGPYDLIFLDAAKGQYPTYFPEIKRLLSSGGIFISDNVLFNGYVAKGAPDRHRNKTIVVRLDEYLKMLEADTDFKTVLLPISDGVTLSIKN